MEKNNSEKGLDIIFKQSLGMERLSALEYYKYTHSGLISKE
jgi:hypothetical protein